jgi:hypothetical protein
VRHKGPFIPPAAADRAGRGRIDFIQQTEGMLPALWLILSQEVVRS